MNNNYRITTNGVSFRVERAISGFFKDSPLRWDPLDERGRFTVGVFDTYPDKLLAELNMNRFIMEDELESKKHDWIPVS